MLFQETETAALEVLLFVANEPLNIDKLAEILEISSENVLELIDILNNRYKNLSCGFNIVNIKDGYRLGTKPELANYIETLYKQPTKNLSNAALEVLSIVAYKQPVTRGEVDFIRGVQSDRSLITLAEKGLIYEVGRKDSPGRPILYGTTEKFLLHFGLRNVDELPELLFEEGNEEDENEGEDDIKNEKEINIEKEKE
ncbi:MAG: SMC-Scp complex subunit ScpB [Eubacteriales bacterium]